MSQTNNNRWTSPERLIIIGVIMALVFALTGFEVASAAVKNDALNSACYKTKNGNLRIAVTPCKASEAPLSLNSAGDTDATDSDPVIEGFHDASVSFTNSGAVVATLSVGAGSYVLNAKTILFNGSAFSPRDQCQLAAGADSDLSAVSLPPNSSATLAMQTVHTFASPDSVTVTCTTEGSAPLQSASQIKIAAAAATSVSAVSI